ncbi:MAG: LmeA family phospholipid-binding protein [Nitriliruptor sp.]
MEVVLALLIALVVVAVVTATVAERWAHTRGLLLAGVELARELGTASPAAVDVPARPLLPALLTGEGTQAHVSARDVPVGDDARLRDLTATIDGVRAVVRSRRLDTGHGTFTALIDEAELSRLVSLPGVVARLEVRAAGLRVWTVLGIAVDADVLVHDGELRVIPDPAQVGKLLERPGLAAFRRAIDGRGLLLELPPLPFGARVETLDFLDAQVEVTGRLAPQEFTLRAPR